MLPVVVAYFNPFNDVLREMNTLKFLEYLNMNKDVEICLVEALHPNSKLLPLHIHTRWRVCVEPKTLIWRKENLINMGVRFIDRDCFAWIDSDITFMRQDWVRATLDLFNKGLDIVQLFSQAIILTKDRHVDAVSPCVLEENISGITPHEGNMLNGQCGFAWAMSQRMWKKMKGFYDKGIVGTGDAVLAYSLLDTLQLLRGEVSTKHWESLEKWHIQFMQHKPIKGWLEEVIVHNWHGELAKRQYMTRLKILTDAGYNPMLDTEYDKGILELSEKGMRMQPAIENFFRVRAN